MSTRRHARLRRPLCGVAVTFVVLAMTACTGRGGGQLPPAAGFDGPASFGFQFGCADRGGLNPPTGRVQIQLSYTDHGANAFASGFGIHGVADTIDPVVESAICIGTNPPPGGNELIFLGRFRLTSSPPASFPSACAQADSRCRFEVIVRDNDNDRAPSTGDYFHIALSSATAISSELASSFYTRGGLLSSGNLTVD